MCFCNKNNPMPICENCPPEKRALFKDVSDDPKSQELLSTPVKVVVLHKPTNKFSANNVRLKDVRRYAEQAVKSFGSSDLEDFVVIEIGRTNSVRVSELKEYYYD